jgi:hypothetical protein
MFDEKLIALMLRRMRKNLVKAGCREKNELLAVGNKHGAAT